MSDASNVHVLVAEDDVTLAELLARTLRAQGHEVTVERDGRTALQAIQAAPIDVAVIDIMMPELDGLEVLRRAREEPDPPEVIVITGSGTIEMAIAAWRLGAYDFLTKPCRLEELELLVRRASEKRRLARENTLLRTQLSRIDDTAEILTQYAPLRALLAMVERVAPSSTPVLITGESGTGKELVARALHRRSGRPRNALIDVHCVAVGEETFERELFGTEYPEGPAAEAGRTVGLLEVARGGTLFLDAVDELHPRIQGKLLRAIEFGTFHRVGGTQQVQVDARIVAATTRDLEEAVAAGTFRQDLYYRINTITLSLPPLRERAVDIPLLADGFLRRFGGAYPPRLSAEALDLMLHYAWPGNVRELRNVIERAVLLTTDGVIRARDLPLAHAAPPAQRGTNGPAWYDLTLEEAERRHIAAVLEETDWVQLRAAERLGISVKTLYRKIREYGFQKPAM